MPFSYFVCKCTYPVWCVLCAITGHAFALHDVLIFAFACLQEQQVLEVSGERQPGDDLT